MVSYCDLVRNSMTMNKLKHIFIFMLLFPDESSISTHNSTVRLCTLQETAQTGPIDLCILSLLEGIPSTLIRSVCLLLKDALMT